MIRNRLFAILSLVVLTAMVLSACGGAATTPASTNAPDQPTIASEQPTTAPEQPTTAPDEIVPITIPDINPADATGDIITAGSSTVFPLSEKMAEIFQQEGYSGNITVDSIGTGAGFERFCKTGETDIANASRPIKSEEVEACRAIGREPIGFRVGTDALAVVVNPDSPVAERGLTMEELALIFNGDAQTWADLDPALPADAISIYSPGTDSGTFDYFVEVVLAKSKDGLLAIEGAQFSEDDNVLVQGVEGDKNAIGYFGFAYYVEQADKLTALAINTVQPGQESVDAGTYPLARPLFIYSDATIMADKPQVANYIGFYLLNVNAYINEVGYFPAPAAALNSARGTWLAAAGYEIDPAAVAGDIITAGSSTVFPLSEKMAEIFQQEGYSGNITVDSIGTGAGFERFCKTGETDIANASRPIKSEEVEACRAIGREPIGFRVGTDALAVVVNPDSPVAERGLTMEELALIFNGDAQTWADLDPALPADAISIYSPGTDSGTFDYFVEVVLAKSKDGLLAIEGAQFSEDDNVLVQGVEGDKNAIGYFGFAYYVEQADKLTALAINTVQPGQESVDAGTYPLARPLFIYSDATIMADKPQVAAFIGFYLREVDSNINDVGYFPAPNSSLNAAIGEWWQAVAAGN